MTATHLDAVATNTVRWLADDVSSVAVPVYQRHYRWELGKCQRLLDDLRAVADRPEGASHFIGSILATAGAGPDDRLTLVDGQQRLTTLTLLAAAVRDSLRNRDAGAAARIERLLVHPTEPGRTKLWAHRDRHSDLERIVLGASATSYEPGRSTFQDNHQFFLREVRDDPDVVWRGMNRLEHVLISLGPSSNPQQVFESLNATGAPLSNHELIHNYVLMGLPNPEQQQVEDTYWAPLEDNTRSALDDFLRDYLIQRTGRDTEFNGEHGVYEVFKREFPPGTGSLPDDAEEWLDFSQVYRVLLDPGQAPDVEIGQHLRYLNVFGTATYPIVMKVYRDYQHEGLSKEQLIDLLEQLQALYLRKMVVGETRDHLAAQLCRRLIRDRHYPIREIARRTPSDDRVRTALRYRPLPHAGYVLQRLQEVPSLDGIEIEHIFPQSPTDTWSGDGLRMWANYREEEKAQHRELLNTIGNLTLLEQPLNAAAGNRAFPDKKAQFRQSDIGPTRDLEKLTAWDVDAIRARADALTDTLLQTWRRRGGEDSQEPELLVPILDAVKKPGWYEGWRNEYAFVKFRDETWEVHDVKALFRMVFTRLWAEVPADVLAYSDANRGPVFRAKAWNGKWEALDETHYLFIGLFPQYLLASVQGVLDELGIADEVFVSYQVETT